MIVIGMALGWAGYALMWRGYSMVRGYDLSNSDIISPTHYYKGAWPPPPAGNATIFPTGSTDNAGASTAATNATTHNAGGTTPPTKGACPPGYTYNPKTKLCVPPAGM